jgi:recombination endonuclease VII
MKQRQIDEISGFDDECPVCETGMLRGLPMRRPGEENKQPPADGDSRYCSRECELTEAEEIVDGIPIVIDYGLFQKFSRQLRFDVVKLLVARQHGRCAICERPVTIPKHYLLGSDRESLALLDNSTLYAIIDHDHSSGLIRGVLCQKCNSGVGLFCDSPGLMARGIEYLSKIQTKVYGGPHMEWKGKPE